jgi:hypothetical protein
MHVCFRVRTVQNTHVGIYQSTGTILVVLYDMAGTTIQHWYCHFHVLQAWRKISRQSTKSQPEQCHCQLRIVVYCVQKC